MSSAIVIRTYFKDAKWLGYCLASVEKFARDFREVIVLFPKEDRDKADWSCIMRSEVGGTPLYAHAIDTVVPDGYIDQQHTKMTADFYTDADDILFLDSDTVFINETRPVDFTLQGRPFLLYTPYERFPSDENMPWQEPTMKAMKHHVAHEFMRRLPIMFPRDIVIKTREYLQMVHGTTVAEYLRHIKNREFSEFNVMGAFVYYHAPGSMTLLPTESIHMRAAGPDFTPNNLPRIHSRQFWSWGNDEEQMREAEGYINV